MHRLNFPFVLGDKCNRCHAIHVLGPNGFERTRLGAVVSGWRRQEWRENRNVMIYGTTLPIKLMRKKKGQNMDYSSLFLKNVMYSTQYPNLHNTMSFNSCSQLRVFGPHCSFPLHIPVESLAL